MKLWQKIFLLTLTLVIIVVNISSLALLSNNHQQVIQHEQQNALAQHTFLDLELKNTIIYTQLTERKLSLSEEQTLQVAAEVINRQQSDTGMGASLYKDGELVSSINQESLIVDMSLLEEPDFTSVIEETDDEAILYIASSVTLSDEPYQLLTSFDISSTYELFRVDFEQTRIIGIVSALLVSGILLLLVRGLLSPLRNLSNATHQIASGDLEKRATIKGHDEVAEVAQSFNTMADSIEQNVTALENLAESRSVFIANLAHEMKTPLTSILGFADILRVKREISDEDRVEYASVIVSETKRLKELSGKLMELLIMGNLQITLEKVEIHDFAAELKTILHPIVKNHEVKLATELPEDRVFIRIDKELMKSLIFNLVDNAIKASRSAGVVRLVIDVMKTDRGAYRVAKEDDRELEKSFMHAEYVRVSVVDTGIGIPADEIPYLIEPFYMLDKARTRKHGGAGLGLTLCSEIAQAHGSNLIIESEQGKGTTVSFILRKEQSDG